MEGDGPRHVDERGQHLKTIRLHRALYAVHGDASAVHISDPCNL